MLKEMKRRILQDEHIAEDYRRGLVIAYNEMYRGFIAVYENCGLEVPLWLEKEFDRDDGRE